MRALRQIAKDQWAEPLRLAVNLHNDIVRISHDRQLGLATARAAELKYLAATFVCGFTKTPSHDGHQS